MRMPLQLFRTPPRNPRLAAFLSLIIPGAGQIYLEERGRGGLILLAALVQAYLISWALNNLNIALVTIGHPPDQLAMGHFCAVLGVERV